MLCFRLCFVPDSFNARTCHCQDLLVRLPDLPGTIDPQDPQDPRDQRDQGWNMLEHVGTCWNMLERFKRVIAGHLGFFWDG